MGNCPSGELWGAVLVRIGLVGSRPDGELSGGSRPGGSCQLGSCPTLLEKSAT